MDGRSVKFASFLRIAQGLGSSHSGTDHFIKHRFSFIWMMMLTFWLMIWLLPSLGAIFYGYSSSGKNMEDLYDLVRAFFRYPLNGIPLMMWLVASLYHGTLCLEVMIQDYIPHSLARALCRTLLYLFSQAIGWWVVFFVLKGLLQ
jgi:succinate dehydrogenase / fumarate reductase, membrane anchor subunit